MSQALTLALVLGNLLTNPSGTLRFSSGAEYDSNARRAIFIRPGGSSATRTNEVIADGLNRSVLIGEGSLGLGSKQRHQVSGTVTLGWKRFFNQSSEDLLNQSVNLNLTSRLHKRLQLNIGGSGRMSRIRNSSRDYNTGSGRAGLRLNLNEQLSFLTSGSLTRFHFIPEKNFSFFAQNIAVGTLWSPNSAFTIRVNGQVKWQQYPRSLVPLTPINRSNTVSLSFCEDFEEASTNGFECTPSPPRRDQTYIANLRLRYVGKIWLAKLGYQLQFQRSNSSFENIDRHRLSGSTSISLARSTNLSLRGAIQITEGVSRTDQQLLAEDDENQNTLQVQVQKKINRIIYLEVRYSLFMNQFGSSSVAFERHSIYAGLAVRTLALQ